MNLTANDYAHGLCTYFAYEIKKMYPDSKLIIAMDTEYLDEDGNEMDELIHVYNELADGVYLDSLGIFFDWKDIEDSYEVMGTAAFIEFESPKIYSEVLSSWGMGCEDPIANSEIQKFLMSHVPTLELRSPETGEVGYAKLAQVHYSNGKAMFRLDFDGRRISVSSDTLKKLSTGNSEWIDMKGAKAR